MGRSWFDLVEDVTGHFAAYPLAPSLSELALGRAIVRPGEVRLELSGVTLPVSPHDLWPIEADRALLELDLIDPVSVELTRDAALVTGNARWLYHHGRPVDLVLSTNPDGLLVVTVKGETTGEIVCRRARGRIVPFRREWL